MQGRTIGWIIGILVLLVIIGLLIWFFSSQSTNTTAKTLSSVGRSAPAAPAAPATSDEIGPSVWTRSTDPFSFVDSEPVDTKEHLARTREIEAWITQFKGEQWDALPASRAVYFEDTNVAVTEPVLGSSLAAGGLQFEWNDPIFSTLPYEEPMQTLPVETVFRDSWTRQYQLLEQLIMLFRLRRQLDRAIRVRIEQLMWLLFNEQRRIALVFIARRSAEFGRRYYSLMIRYLRLVLIALLIRERQEEQQLLRTRAEIDAVVVEIERLMMSGPVAQWERGRLERFTNLFWASNANVMPTWIRDLDPNALPAQVNELIDGWVQSVGGPTGHEPVPVPVVGAATPAPAVVGPGSRALVSDPAVPATPEVELISF